MLKILKNLKKSWLSVVFIVVLLCLQAWTDLTLPDYTSKIVNTGIQAGGIEYVAPEVIRKSQMDNLLIFTDKDEEILSNYTLISKNNLSQEEYNKLQKDYPELENQDLYKLNKLNKEQKEELDELITKPFMTLYFIQNEEMANGMKEQMLLNMPEEQKQVMAQMPLIDLIKNMPNEQKENLPETVAVYVVCGSGCFAVGCRYRLVVEYESGER